MSLFDKELDEFEFLFDSEVLIRLKDQSSEVTQEHTTIRFIIADDDLKCTAGVSEESYSTFVDELSFSLTVLSSTIDDVETIESIVRVLDSDGKEVGDATVDETGCTPPSTVRVTVPLDARTDIRSIESVEVRFRKFTLL